MLVLGIAISDLALSVTILDADTLSSIAQKSQPIQQSSPQLLYRQLTALIIALNRSGVYNPLHIEAIGISSTVHPIVLLDNNQQVIREATRTTLTGHARSQTDGAVFLLLGDFISFQLTAEPGTTTGLLSAAAFWDFQYNQPHQEALMEAGLSLKSVPTLYPTFGNHGLLQPAVAVLLGLRSGTPVHYKAAALANNALGLQVLRPFEVGMTSGEEGAIITVNDQPIIEDGKLKKGAAHINHHADRCRTIHDRTTGPAIALYKRFRDWVDPAKSLTWLSQLAGTVPTGCKGLSIQKAAFLPYSQLSDFRLFQGFDDKLHSTAHMARAVLEGIAFQYRCVWEELTKEGLVPSVIRAPVTQLFSSAVFCKTMANLLQTHIELYDINDSHSAALGALAGVSKVSICDLFRNLKPKYQIAPYLFHPIEGYYGKWCASSMAEENMLLS